MTTLVHILSDSNFSGGPMHVLALVKGLDREVFTSIIVGPQGPMLDVFRQEGIDVHVMTPSSKFQWGRVGDLRTLLAKLMTQQGTTIVHCHGPRAGLFGRLAARTLDCKIVYSEHLWTRDYRLPNRINSLAQLTALRFLDRFTTKTIGVSQSVVDFLIQSRITPPSKIVRIYNGIELPTHQIAPAGTPTLGSVGSLTWQKNYGWLIDLMPQIQKTLPDARLEIIGSGPQHAELTDLINRLGLGESVTLIDPVPHDQLVDHYQKWAVYIQPSTNESFGIAAAEAAAAGLPVIGSNRGSLPEILGRADATFDLADPDAAVAAIVSLLQDETKRQELQTKELAHVRQFSLPAMVKAHSELYSSLA